MIAPPIFLVDDDQDFVGMQRDTLEGKYHRQVIVADTHDPAASARALAADPRCQGAVAVVDLAIPGAKGNGPSVQEGLRLIHWLRDRHFRVWVVSGYLDEDDNRARAAELGVEGFIDKGELTAGLEHMLRQIDQPGGGAEGPPAAAPSPLDERERAQRADYEWALNDARTRKEHGGQVVAVLGRRVWGVGATCSQARAAACEQGCPTPRDLALVPVPVAVPAP